MKKLLMISVMACILSGCAVQTFQINQGMADAVPNEEEIQHFFVNGIGQHDKLDAGKICGGSDKIVKVEVEQTFVNGILGLLTSGIYTPRDARVYCAQ